MKQSAAPERDPVHVLLRHISDPAGVYLVGGRVRDHFLGRDTLDTDVVVPSGAATLARQVARSSGGAFVLLDGERDIARIVWPGGATLDVAAMVGGSIEADLVRRDFTVNAMAVPLSGAPEWLASDAPSELNRFLDEAVVARPNHTPIPTHKRLKAALDAVPTLVVDPTGGRADLWLGDVSAVRIAAFEEDPLRLLRAPRLAAELGLEIAGDTREAIRHHAKRLAAPAAERIHEELLRTLSRAGAAWTARTYADLALDAALKRRLWPRAERVNSHPTARDGRSTPSRDLAFPMAALAALDRLTEEDGGEPAFCHFGAYLVASAQGHHSARWPNVAWLRLAALFAHWHADTSEATSRAALRHLAVGGHAARYVVHGLAAAEEVVVLARRTLLERHDVYRLTAKFGAAAGAGCLLSWAAAVAAEHGRRSDSAPGGAQGDAAAPRGMPDPARVCEVSSAVIDMWLQSFHPATRRPALLDGRQIMAALGLAPGPGVGGLLSALHEAQACGELANEVDAWRMVHRLHAERPTISPQPADDSAPAAADGPPVGPSAQ